MKRQGESRIVTSEQRQRNVAGRLIVFEGVDATGKTTLCDELCDILSERWSIQRHHFPGVNLGTLGELVNRIHHHHERDFKIKNIHPCALQLLHIAAHVDVIESSIKQSIALGNWVILDRYWWSTYVYGINSGVNEESLKLMIDLEKQAWGLVKPDIVFLIDSDTPLRDEEPCDDDRERRRKYYLDLLERERCCYLCVRIGTERGDLGKNRALAQILGEIESVV